LIHCFFFFLNFLLWVFFSFQNLKIKNYAWFNIFYKLIFFSLINRNYLYFKKVLKSEVFT